MLSAVKFSVSCKIWDSNRRRGSMRIGVSAFAWTEHFTSSHLDLIPQVRALGLDGFEIPMFNPSDLPAQAIRKAFESNDLECTVCAILPKDINPISPDVSVRKKSLAHLIACVETARELGAHLLGGPLCAPIGYLPGHRRNQSEWDWAVECFQSLEFALEANDLTLSIEPVNRSETLFLTNASDAQALCKAIGNPRVGITIDTFHANIEEKNIADAIALLGARLKHVHLSENDRGLLGSGHINFRDIIKQLLRSKYDGCLMIEGFGYSVDESGSPGYLLADMAVPPEKIASAGASYIRDLLSH
jgi:D-psicose/D-tagatose/L-ribulose 3-epimerase